MLFVLVLPWSVGYRCYSAPAPTSFLAGFDTGVDSFLFTSDGFRGTSNPAYSVGAYDATGGFDGGGLSVELGGIDDLVVGEGISGGWHRVFRVPSEDVVTVTLRYRIQLSAASGAGDCSQVLVAIDSALVASSGDVVDERCGDGTAQDSGWQQTSFDVQLSAGSHWLHVGGWMSGKASADEQTTIHFDEVAISVASEPLEVELLCTDLLDNDGDGLVDCADPDCLGKDGCPLFFARFDSDTDGFSYEDDTFFDTARPDYADGAYDPAGGASGGGLVVLVGGVDNKIITGGMSGGWTRTFELAAPSVVRVAFVYRIQFPEDYESNECSRVLVSVDGGLSGPGLRDPLLEVCGGIGNFDSGWVDVSFEVPLPGGTHDLTLGAWNNRKNQLEELTIVHFDDVEVTPLVENVLFSDSFDETALPGWSVVDQSGDASEWSVADGLLLQDDPRIEKLATSFYLGTFVHADTGSAWSDYRFRAKLESPAQSPGGGDPDTVGLLFRYQGPDDYYRLVLSRKLGFRRLEKRVGGVFANLAFDGRGFEPGRGVDVTVDVRGIQLVVEIDGEPVFAVEDSDLAIGTIGLHAESRARFEHVVVSEPAVSPRIALSTPVSFSVSVPLGASPLDQLNAACLVSDAPGALVRFQLDPGSPEEQEILVSSAPYEAQFNGVVPGDHVVQALLETSAGVVDTDTRVAIGVAGNSLVGFGDSITAGVGDAQLGASLDDRNIGRGYAPPLNDALSAVTTRPTIVFNEGVGGEKAGQGVARIGETLLRHPDADLWLVLFGTNDSRDPASPSGITCSEADLAAGLSGCANTYKDHMRAIVLAIQAVGAIPVLGKVPFVQDAPAARDAAIQEYNQVIDQLVAEHGLIVTPPDFYTYFLMNPEQMADPLHPTNEGYQAMAALWAGAIATSGLLDVP